ncbi:MAG: metallophosphoesterase [Candidatus Woesearchaeota archaeon]|jgi:hypothetical protein
MRLFACGDIHGDTDLASKLAKKAKDANVDVIVLTGDITSHTQEFENLIGPFKKLNKKIFIINGNHDDLETTEFISKKYGLYHLNKKSYVVDDVTLFGCGGSNVGLARMSEDELFDYIKKSHDSVFNLDSKINNNADNKKAKTKIMITHNHPSKTMMANLSNIVKGSDGVLSAIYELKPEFLLCSHVHEGKGIEEMIGKTKVINVSKIGKVLDL